MDLTERKKIGYEYIREQLDMGKLGENYYRNSKSFFKGEEERLQKEYENMERLMKLVNSPTLRRLEVNLSYGKYLINTIEKLGKSGLTEVEFFEIKQFALLVNLVKPLIEELDIDIEKLNEMQGVLSILDPKNTLSMSFAIYDYFDDRLFEIRKNKGQYEGEIEKIIRENAWNADLQSKKEAYDYWVGCENSVIIEVLNDLSKKLKDFKENLVNNTRILGHIELLIKKTKLAHQTKAIRPTICEYVSFKKMFNPLYVKIQSQNNRQYTCVDITLKKGAAVLSGANMGGKSFALNTIALNCYLAQKGFFVYAKECQMTLFDEICLISKEEDGHKDGLSSFGKEIVNINKIVETAKSKFALILIDEFARGTNAEEGCQIACGVVKYFNSQNAISLFTTHFDKLSMYGNTSYKIKGLKENVGNIKNMSVYDIMDYTIIENPNHIIDKQALKICQLLNLSTEILDCIPQ